MPPFPLNPSGLLRPSRHGLPGGVLCDCLEPRRLFYAATPFGPATRVDTSGDVGQYASLAISPTTQRPAVSYYDATHASLKYAALGPGGEWSVRKVDASGGAGRYPSLAFDARGRPRVSYYDEAGGDLKYAAWDGSSWATEVVDGAGSDVGKYTSLALDAAGDPRISYRDVTDNTLKYAARDGLSWDLSVVAVSDGFGDTVGDPSVLVLDADGTPHVAYDPARAVAYATFDGASWHSQVVSDLGNVLGETGVGVSLAVDRQGNPDITATSFGQGETGPDYLAPSRGAWSRTVVDAFSDGVGEDDSHGTSLALTGAGLPAFTYIGDNQELDLATAATATPAFALRTIDPHASEFDRFAIAATGDAWVSYYDPSRGDLLVREASRLFAPTPHGLRLLHAAHTRHLAHVRHLRR